MLSAGVNGIIVLTDCRHDTAESSSHMEIELSKWTCQTKTNIDPPGGEKCKDFVPHSTIEREQVCNAGSLDYNQGNFYGS